MDRFGYEAHPTIMKARPTIVEACPKIVEARLMIVEVHLTIVRRASMIVEAQRSEGALHDRERSGN